MPPRDAALAATPAMAPEEAYTRRGEGAGLSVAAASAPTRSPRQGPKTGTGRPGPFTREIKIWDPSMLPLGATTHNQDTYKAYKIAPAPSSAAQATYMPSPHKCDGTTTSAEVTLTLTRTLTLTLTLPLTLTLTLTLTQTPTLTLPLTLSLTLTCMG